MAQSYARDVFFLLAFWKFILVLAKYNDKIKGIHQFLAYFHLWVFYAMLIYDEFFLHLHSIFRVIDFKFCPFRVQRQIGREILVLRYNFN